MIVSGKCKNCLNFYEGAPRDSLTYEYHIRCEEHYGRFWDIVLDEKDSCPLYKPFQLSFDDIEWGGNKND